MIKLYSLILLIFVSFLSAHAQEEIVNVNNSWFLFNLDYKLHDKWKLANELHLRRADGLKDKKQFLWRPSAAYNISDQIVVTAGVTYIENYPYSNFSPPTRIPELNIWEQISFSTTVGKLKFIQHHRLEHRFLGKPVLNSGNYEIQGHNKTQRLRSRFMFSFPVVRLSENEHVILSVFDEIQVNVPDFRVTGLNQNWLYAGVTYPANRTKIQLGYMNQWVRINEETFESNRVIWLAVSYDLSRMD